MINNKASCVLWSPWLTSSVDSESQGQWPGDKENELLDVLALYP